MCCGNRSGARENAQDLCVFGDGDDGQIRNCLPITGGIGGVSIEKPFTVVVIFRDVGMGIVGVADGGKSELGVPPHEFSVVELGVKRDCTAGVFWNVQTIVNSVRRARRNQADINEGACGPSISFVDEIAVSVNLERPIEVRALLNRAFSSVFNPAAPEDSLVFIISGLQLEPDVEGVDGAAW